MTLDWVSSVLEHWKRSLDASSCVKSAARVVATRIPFRKTRSVDRLFFFGRKGNEVANLETVCTLEAE